MRIILLFFSATLIVKAQTGATILSPTGNSIKTSTLQIGNGDFTNLAKFSSYGTGSNLSSGTIHLPFFRFTSNFGINSIFESSNSSAANIGIKSTVFNGYNHNIGIWSKSGDDSSVGTLNIGLLGEASQNNTMGLGIGVYGISYDKENALNTGNSNTGVQGYAFTYVRGATGGTFYSYTNANNDSYSIGVKAIASGDNTATGTKYGIYAQANGSGNIFAGYFSGNVHVNGNLSKSGGTFRIDHPLDPENKYLQHSFVESPDMMNIYNGIITTNAQGDAEVQLPQYFEALNKDFRYQLTCIGKFAQVIVSHEISENKFSIKSDTPNVKVSWQVTGIRKDPWAIANPILPETEKSKVEKGKYLNPDVYNKTDKKSIHYLEY